jgi:lipoate-protein ligase A
MVRLVVDLVPARPTFALALEEALFESVFGTGPNTLRMWVNQRVIVVGRSQSAAAEVDFETAAHLGIPILRRISGGGTVYHYPGNLNISLFLRQGAQFGDAETVFNVFGSLISFELEKLGVKIRPCMNSLLVGEKKIGGAAQVRRGQTVLYHTTLLVEADTIDMGTFLRAMRVDYQPGGVPSHPYPTTTLRRVSDREVTLEEVVWLLTGPIVRQIGCCAHEERLTMAEYRRAEELECVKYRSDKWNRFP